MVIWVADLIMVVVSVMQILQFVMVQYAVHFLMFTYGVAFIFVFVKTWTIFCEKERGYLGL